MKKTGAAAAGLPAVRIPENRVLAGTSIKPLEVYHVRDVHPEAAGPWSAEPDKLSWIDPDTGMPCIIRRADDGALRGYVGVRSEHPLFGVAADALSHDPPIVVHGGVDYAQPCEEDAPQERSVCHVPAPVFGSPDLSRPLSAPGPNPTVPARRAPDELWWFGFSCDKSYDLVPGRLKGGAGALSGENGRTYRDERYVVREVTDLAAQLHAVETSLPMPEPRKDRPPIGLDPYDPRDVL